jgi:hypothetical protein
MADRYPDAVAAAALAYAAEGLPVFPCDPANKRPLTPHSFKDATTDPEVIVAWWARWPNAMIGMPTGKPSGFWVLDIDDPESFAASAPELPPTRKATTGKGYHLYWRIDPDREVRNAQRHPRTGWPFLTMPGAEVRGEGGYVILPPSRHPTGRLYTWENEGEAMSAPAALLAVVTQPKRRQSETKAKSLADDRNGSGIDTPYGLKALESECRDIRAACDGEQESALNTGALRIGALVSGGELAHATARRELISAGLAMASFDPGNEWTHEAVAAKVDRALLDGAANPRSAQRPGQHRDWPEPLSLGDELLPVMPCEVEMLPAALGSWLGDIAERMNVPLDMVAIPALVAAGSLIGRRVGIRPQQHTDWQEAGNLWGCVVAPPGAKKSPAASEALAPLKALEHDAAKGNGEIMAEHERAMRAHKLASEHADNAARGALKKGDDPLSALSALAPPPDLPAERRYLTSDATAEKLGEICAANPHGVAVHRDELLSLFTELDRDERAGARGFFLSGWNGNESYTFDRIGRGTIRIPAVNISLFGTTQPDRLARYMTNSLQRFNDGMVQRLQLLAWPDFSSPYVECDRAAISEARQAAWRFYSELATIDTQELRADWDGSAGPGHFPFLRFATDAQALFSAWMEGLEAKVRGGELEPALTAHLSKYRGLVPRLALLCHIANDASGPVSREALQMAIRWGEYLETHARRAYGAIALDNASAARSVWRRVTRGDLSQSFTARDIYRRGWGGLDRERVEAGLNTLCGADWLASEEAGTAISGGRPSKLYRPNPKALMGANVQTK